MNDRSRAHDRAGVPATAYFFVPLLASLATVFALRPQRRSVTRASVPPRGGTPVPRLVEQRSTAALAAALTRPAGAVPPGAAPRPSSATESTALGVAVRLAFAHHAAAGVAPPRRSTSTSRVGGLSRTSQLLGIAMVLWFAAAYLWQYRLGGQVWPTFRGTYVAGPYLWTICAAVACAAWKSTPRPAHETNAVPLAFVAGAFAVAVTVLAGLAAGIGHSPYAHSPYWLLTNAFYVGAPLCAFEFGRAYLLRVFGGRVTLAVATTAILATLLGFSYRRLLNWDGSQPEVIFLGSRFLPDLASNLLASLLVYVGGPFAGITYRGVVAVYEWYSPILADLPWLAAAFVGVAAPAVGLWVLDGLHGHADDETATPPRRWGAPSTAWMLTSTASLAILWGTFGFFGVRPSFVPSHSMEPAIDPGSIAVTRPVNPDSVQVGDIVMYQRGRTHVLHRVIEKRPDGAFIFKGDHNNTPDPDPVLPQQIEGRLIIDVPYAGWVPIWTARAFRALAGL
ncbi:MAG: signal peptidase I [Dehalococcoidia bacterium]|nr:MAG: signal peptidase I [Dehalococcoidia bacterium]